MERFHSQKLNHLPYRQVILEADSNIVEGLKGVDTKRMFAVLTSSRRVFRILDGAKMPSQLNASRTINSMMPDISYDLESFQGVHLTTEEIKSNLALLSYVQSCFVPLQDYFARAINRRDGFNDINEVTSVAESVVERAIWSIFVPPQTDDIEEIAYSLGLCVGNVLRHLPHYVNREMYGDFLLLKKLNEVIPIIDFEAPPLDQLASLSEMDSDDVSRRESLAEWHDTVNRRNLGLVQAMKFIERIEDVRMQRALLYYFGYISKEELPNQALETGLIQRDLNRGLSALNAIAVSTHQPLGEERTDIRDFVAKINQYSDVYDREGKALKFNSVRLGLDPEAIKRRPYPPTKRRVLEMALEKDVERFVYSYADIAAETGLSVSAVEHIIARATAVVRYRVDGHAIPTNSNHMWLIDNRDTVSPYQLAALTPLQRQIYDFVTTPNETGAYPHETFAQEALNFKQDGFMGKIRGCLEDGKIIRQTMSDIASALQEKYRKFSPEEILFLQFVLGRINSGEPMRNYGEGIRWRSLIGSFKDESGITIKPHFAPSFRARLQTQ